MNADLFMFKFFSPTSEGQICLGHDGGACTGGSVGEWHWGEARFCRSVGSVRE